MYICIKSITRSFDKNYLEGQEIGELEYELLNAKDHTHFIEKSVLFVNSTEVVDSAIETINLTPIEDGELQLTKEIWDSALENMPPLELDSDATTSTESAGGDFGGGGSSDSY